MKVLAVESSSVVAGAAIISEDQLIYEGYYHNKKNHSRILMPMVEEAMDTCNISISDIDIFAVSSGPGSFTGLRIGIATIKGLAHAVNKPVASIPTLDVLAYGIPSFHGVVCPILDARREQVYTSIYRWERDTYIRLNDYKAMPILELVKVLEDMGSPVMFTGDGIPAYKEVISEHLMDMAVFAPPNLRHQRPSTTALLGIEYFRGGRCINYKALEPFYLRKSQAEQNLKGTCVGR